MATSVYTLMRVEIPPRPWTLPNRYAQWVSFGSSGLATAPERDEQRKMVKYNHLVANLLIFHTVVGGASDQAGSRTTIRLGHHRRRNAGRA